MNRVQGSGWKRAPRLRREGSQRGEALRDRLRLIRDFIEESGRAESFVDWVVRAEYSWREVGSTVSKQSTVNSLKASLALLREYLLEYNLRDLFLEWLFSRGDSNDG